MSKCLFVMAIVCSVAITGQRVVVAEDATSVRLPGDVPPVIGCWFWTEGLEFQPEGYRQFIDMAGDHSPYNILTTSTRAPHEVTDDDVHARVKKTVAYARKRGLGIVMDLDVRMARRAFQKKYPDELQEMLRLKEVDLPNSGEVAASIESYRNHMSDHQTMQTTPYIALSGRLVRVYSYVHGPQGIEPGTVEDITDKCCKIKHATAKEVSVVISCGEHTKGRRACVMASFTHFVAAIFAPHLMEFQREIYQKYADVDLAGICKDEWGFPPWYSVNPPKNNFWYSRFRAAAYAERTGGRDLVQDCLLMYLGERGRDGERQGAINHFMEMNWQRHAVIVDDNYRAAKEVFGPSAFVGTHPTWYPPIGGEFKKNGLYWWCATRDFAQTDLATPYCVRTALAKKWGSPVWYNMYFSKSIAFYEKDVWSHALGGGRINYHPPWPVKWDYLGQSHCDLFRGGLMRADCRIRLLNFITKTPLDCPVAVIFGHACAMNWAGPGYNDVGLGVADGLWQAGFPADLIPADEILGKALRISDDGYVQYGPQRYAAVVLYHPEFEKPKTAAFFQRAARGKTALYRIGDWTADFDGKPFDGNAALPSQMVATANGTSCVHQVVAHLRKLRIAPQTPAAKPPTRGGGRNVQPPPKGRCRLIDGTHIIVSGEEHVTGDPIQTTFDVKGRKVEVDAVGVVAVRLADDGNLEAMAAGGLKNFQVGTFKITLQQPVDIALWRDEQGKMHGVLQDWHGPVPPALAAITDDWLRLAVPVPLGDKKP